MKFIRFVSDNRVAVLLLAGAAFLLWVSISALNVATLPKKDSGGKVTVYVDPLFHPLKRGEEWGKVHKVEIFDHTQRAWKEVGLLSEKARTAMETGHYTIVYAPAPGTLMGSSESTLPQGGFLRADLRGALRKQ